MNSTILLTATSDALVHSLWQITLISLIIYLIQTIVPARFLQTRYLIAAFGLCLVPICFILTLGDALLLKSDHGTGISFSESGELDLVIISLWFGSFALGAAELVSHYFEVRRLRNAPFQRPSAALSMVFEQLVARMKISRPIELRLSDYVQSPSCFGALKPIIFLPMMCITQLSQKELEAILLHELAHIRRYDYVWAWIQSGVKILFYYHPGTHYLTRSLVRETEHRCDALAVGADSHPKDLATALLRLSISRHNTFVLRASAPTKADLYGRIERLTGIPASEKSHRSRSRTLATFSALIVTLTVVFTVGKTSAVSLPYPSTPIDEPSLTHMSVVSLKDEICRELRADEIYWDPKYDQGGPVEITHSADGILINGTDLPHRTQSKLRPIFEKYGLNDKQHVSVIFYHENIDVELSLNRDQIMGDVEIFSISPDEAKMSYERLSADDII